MQQYSKHASAASDTDATTEDVFSVQSVSTVYDKGQQQ
jgi:hypothetical protein